MTKARVGLAEQVIRFLKAQPLVCESGLEALRVLEEASVDLICMDLHMPVLSGVEAVRRIRRQEEQLGRRRTPVIALTSSALPEELATCLAQGMDDVMTKPVTIDTLRRVLSAWCPDREARASAK